MGSRHALALLLLGLLVAVGWYLFSLPVPADTGAAAAPDAVFTEADRRIFDRTIGWAAAERLDTLEIGDIVVAVGRRFIGSPYAPHTLDGPGPERLIVNLREFDCVTYVESVLAIARVVRAGGGDFDAFTVELRRIRYRDGRIDGYPSRLHYFSEWISDNQSKGILRAMSRQLGGIRDDEPIDFMSSHADAYPRLAADTDLVRPIRAMEEALGPRYFIPEERIGGVADRIRGGDVIAATSTVPGLDIAHTGIAVRIDGRIHLMHAPLADGEVEISRRPLADRVAAIDGQDGVMVARPL